MQAYDREWISAQYFPIAQITLLVGILRDEQIRWNNIKESKKYRMNIYLYAHIMHVYINMYEIYLLFN